MVPLAHGLGPAIIDQESYNRLKEDGWSFFWLIRHFPDNPQFVANSSHTPPPMEEISLCGHPTALI